MVDVQDIQKELLAAVRKGQEQLRKSQDKMREGQEQVRKSREAVSGVVSELTKNVLPGLPALGELRVPTPAELRTHAQELVSQAMTVQHTLTDTARQTATPYAERVRTAQRDLADKARQNLPYADRILAAQQDLAERARRAGISDQVTAAQRTLTDKILETSKVAAPIVADGVARLSQLVGSWAEATTAGRADEDAPADDAPVVEIGQSAADAAEVTKPKAKTTKTTAKTTTAKSASKAKLSVAPEAGATATSKPRTPKN